MIDGQLVDREIDKRKISHAEELNNFLNKSDKSMRWNITSHSLNVGYT